MWVVKIVVYGWSDSADVYGVYSNLALAGCAAMQAIENGPDLLTFIRFEEPWGYRFMLTAHTYGDSWHYGEIEIGRVTLND